MANLSLLVLLIPVLLFLMVSPTSFAATTAGHHANSTFSGFYIPSIAISSEDFSASWLVSKDRFLKAAKKIRGSTTSIAGVSFSITRDKCFNNTLCHSLMTRDYFDFMVEHMSSTSNLIPFGNKDIFRIVNDNIKVTANRMNKATVGSSRNYHKKQPDKRLGETLAVLVYSTLSFSTRQTDEQAVIRESFFAATFHSVHRYFPKVAVFVANQENADQVRNMSLPYYMLTIIDDVPLYGNKTVLLPKLSLETIINATTADPNNTKYGWAKYIFFSEGDQILHMRHAKHIYDVIDASLGDFAVVPHRMQTIPLKYQFSKDLQDVWTPRKNGHNGQMNLKEENIQLVTESLGGLRGSCCDAGRNEYASDLRRGGRWWYNYPDWGLVNITTWLRVGKTGLTFPTISEHKGVCEYSPTKQVCPLPPDCSARVPVLADHKNRHGTWEKRVDVVCRMIPTVNAIGDFELDRELLVKLAAEKEAKRLKNLAAQQAEKAKV